MLSVGAIVGYSILGVVGGYITTSIIILNCPGVLHKKKKPHFRVSHISHRGGAAENLENTLTAYHHAVNVGTQMLEIDVHMSKDKHVVVSHDESLERSCGCDGVISDYDYADLPFLKKELQVTFYGSTTCQHDGDPEKIPTLEEVFQQFPNVPINLDIKGEDEELMEKACELIKKYQREKITVWGNFRDTTTQKLYKMNPEVPLLFSLRRVVLLYVWFYFGLLPFMPLKESYFEIALPDIIKHVDFQLSSGQRRILSIMGFLMKSRILINHLKKRGIPTYLWVLNDEKDFETAFKLGAEGVMTDCPTKLTQWLDENPQYKV